MAAILAASLLPHPLAAQRLNREIEAVLSSIPPARRGFWGIHVVHLAGGRTLAAYQQDRPFVPASTAKLWTAALALSRLGADYRFTTLVTAGGPPDAAGRIAGDLVLVGGGDPTLSGRPMPFGSKQAAGDPLQAIEDLAAQVTAHGVKRIDGNVVGDDTAYPWEPYAEGRAQEDALWDYGAPVSALTLNENRLALGIHPSSRAGGPAQLRLSPPLEYFVIENRVRTAAAGETRIQLERMQGSRQLRVWGTVAARSPTSRFIAVEDPAEYAATALYEALARRGVTIGGKPVARHRFVNEMESQARPGAAAGVQLARLASPPLSEILEITSKESLNLHAELVLREVGRVRRTTGSRQAALEELRAFLGEVGVPKDECSLVDGSGLSMLDSVAPRALTRLLAYMHASPLREEWLKLLPLAGKEGTLEHRLEKAPPGSIRAKSGSMTRVNGLAGYATGKQGSTLAFAVLVNNYTAPAAEIRALVDRICMLLLDEGN
ncbi:MAG: D-alanyl-D-alanine carboxypeptidase/D-alanyl-D-alanine-endopeptidase [Bryobacterales bacterium]|nr:D-alanyl-D-alanine carboxypeptidase/D-alanyl-D-alanine-endopeptidase [Bryobacterales bacterium]